jgi:hypothetical protein
VVSIMSQLFYPLWKSPCNHRTGGWVVPRASLDAMEKRKISAYGGNQRLIPQPSSPWYDHYNDQTISALLVQEENYLWYWTRLLHTLCAECMNCILNNYTESSPS